MDLAILARAPVPGECKTRLIPELGAQFAARLQADLTRQTVSTALQAAVGRVTLWTAGDPGHTFFRQLAKDFPDLKFIPQMAGDLGDRMHQVFVNNAASTLLMGSDCPVITSELLKECAEALSQKDAVFLPAEDGGYALVGLRQPSRALFQGIGWGGHHVMQQTREQLHNQGMTWCEPQQVWDVDLPEDAKRFLDLKKLQYEDQGSANLD